MESQFRKTFAAKQKSVREIGKKFVTKEIAKSLANIVEEQGVTLRRQITFEISDVWKTFDKF